MRYLIVICAIATIGSCGVAPPAAKQSATIPLICPLEISKDFLWENDIETVRNIQIANKISHGENACKSYRGR